MSRENFLWKLMGVSRWVESWERKSTEQKKIEENWRKAIIEICNAECANCEKWVQQKKCSSCAISQILSRVREF